MKTWRQVLLVAASVGLAAAGQARSEVDEVKLVSQYGIGYMQLTLMNRDKLVEKHLAKAGLAAKDIAYRLERDEFRGKVRLQARLADFRVA